jgi:hypothetical protein
MYGKTDYLIAVCKEVNDNDDNDKARSWKCWNFELLSSESKAKLLYVNGVSVGPSICR